MYRVKRIKGPRYVVYIRILLVSFEFKESTNIWTTDVKHQYVYIDKAFLSVLSTCTITYILLIKLI